jgi:predicted Zn-dependent protease
LEQVEQAAMREALKPFHQPKLREAVINIKRSLEQVIDEITPDELLRAGYDPQALEKAKTLITNFRQFIEDNKDEIEALQLLYSHPYRAGCGIGTSRSWRRRSRNRRSPPARCDCGRRIRRSNRQRFGPRAASSWWT